MRTSAELLPYRRRWETRVGSRILWVDVEATRDEMRLAQCRSPEYPPSVTTGKLESESNGTHATTEQSESIESSAASETPGACLVVVWSASDARLGQTLVPPAGRPGPWRVFGRGSAQESDGAPRIELSRPRPDAVSTAASLQNAKISRQQLRLRCSGPDVLELENLGRCALIHAGTACTHCEVRVGDLVQLGTQLLLVCMPRLERAGEDRYPTFPFGHADPFGLVGESAAMWRLRQRIAFVAPQREHVLVLGASGSGKELVAHALHALSSRGSKPMVSRNAATLPAGVIDAELFGTARDFPNAGMPERAGLVGSADGTTLFLDEFSELPRDLQPHLLRVLDAGEYQRLGDSAVLRSDFRLIAATSRALETLKHDVAARIPFHVLVPDLNERRSDIPLLVAHVLRKLGRSDRAITRFFPGGTLEAWPRVSLSLMRALVEREYTAHVRELASLLWDRIGASAPDSTELRADPSWNPDDATAAFSSSPPRRSTTVPPGLESLPPSPVSGARTTAERIQDALDEHNGSIERTWRALGLSNRYALRRLIAKHGLEVRRRRPS